jgi:sulfate permease, SulP family
MNLRLRPAGAGRSRVPILAWMPAYQRGWLRGDLTAGAIVAALAVPQALGYAAIAGVPVQVGLYAVPTALLAYAVFGTSPQLVVGPVSTVSVLSGSLVSTLDVQDESEAIAYTVALALGAGLVLLGVGLLKVGWVSEFLSAPIVTGFVFGLTALVIIGETPKLVGVPVPSGDVLDRIGALFSSIGEFSAPTTAIALLCLGVLFGFGRVWPRVPWPLVLVLVATAASSMGGWEEAGIAVVGDVPAGLPLPGLPGIDAERLGWVLVSGAALALVGLAEGLSAARLFATRGGYRVDADQELIATGAANIASGLFGGIGVAGSLSKTAAVVDARGRTQVAGITTALLALLVIVAVAPMLAALPLAVLSAVVVKAVWGLMDLDAVRRYRDVRRLDFVAALVAAAGVLALGPLPGLGVAIGLSVLGLVYRSSRVTVEPMGRIPGEKAAWGSLEDHPERRSYPGIMVLRIDVPVFWVNAVSCSDGIMAHVTAGDDVRVVVIDLEGTNALDTTSADTLGGLVGTLHQQGVDVYLARVRYHVRQLLRRSGVMDEIGEDHVWHSISQAVRQARRTHGITAPAVALDTDAALSRVPLSGEDEFGHRWSPFGP